MMPVDIHGPLSASLHSVSSTPSHTDLTDAAVSYTNSSTSVSSLTTSHGSKCLLCTTGSSNTVTVKGKGKVHV